jgi:hypothetical protein
MIDSTGEFVQDTVGESAGFRSEYQKQTPGTDHGPERFCSSFGKQGHLIIARRRIFQKFVKIIPGGQLDIFPVVKSGSFHLTTFKRKPQGSDEVQIGTGSQTGSSDIPGIPVDFRLNQDNVALDRSVIALKRVLAQFPYTESFEVFI